MTHITPVSPDPSIPVTRVRGALGEKVLRKSPELFNQGLPTVLAEVLQNSRRAGATRVEIEHFGEEGRATLVVRDDGHGIADMAKLVTFGSSDWDERTDLVENAAGMGVFSLASRGVTVRSLGRRVTLSRAVFCGEAEAAVLPDPEMGRGTELLFPVDERAVTHVIERVCRFYPVPVTLNGKPVEQLGFLDGAAHIVEWQGLRLGVFGEFGPKVLDLFDRHRGWDRRLYLNFHGHVVECDDAVHLAEVGGRSWSVFVDVVSAPDLRLVLPARNEPIDNDFLRAMRARAQRAILECIAGQPTHSLPFRYAGQAATLGVVLPPVEIALVPWGMSSDQARHRREPEPVLLGTPGGEVLLVDDATLGGTSEEANLHQLLKGWEGGARVVQTEPAFVGYPAYDALRAISDLTATATGPEGAVEELSAAAADGPIQDESEQLVVEAVTARLLVRDGRAPHGEPVVVHEAAAPFFFTADADWGSEFPGLVVARSTDVGALADALEECFFVHSDDSDADSYDSQLERYAADARDLARTLLLDDDAAVAARIIEALREARWVLRTLGTGRIELQISEIQDSSTIRIVGADGKEVTAVL